MVGRTLLAALVMWWAAGAPVAWSAAPANGLAADWGGLCQYRDRDRALLARKQVVRAVFMGDSITFLWAGANPGLFGGDYVDRGISGQTTQQMLLRFRQDVIDLHPAAVHILAGTNDLLLFGGAVTLQDLSGDIRSMVELAAANRIAVVLATVPPWGRNVGTPKKRAALLAFNSWLRSYARQRHLLMADYFSVLVDRNGSFNPALTVDGVHPTTQGFTLMEPLAGVALAATLGR